MKKSVVIITTLVYLVAIIVGAFLGYVAEINNPPIYAEDIVMTIEEAPNFPSEIDTYTYYANGAPIYDITYNSEADPEAEDFNKYTYRIKFRGEDEFEYFYYYLNDFNLNLHPYSPLGECENQSLSYYVGKDKRDYISIDKKGAVEFKKYTTMGSCDVMVTTADGTRITIYVNFYW